MKYTFARGGCQDEQADEVRTRQSRRGEPEPAKARPARFWLHQLARHGRIPRIPAAEARWIAGSCVAEPLAVGGRAGTAGRRTGGFAAGRAARIVDVAGLEGDGRRGIVCWLNLGSNEQERRQGWVDQTAGDR